jgi:predicted HAD superfamily Cof-like phosphohydrolase
MSENKSFNGVKEFHVAFDHIVSEKPTAIPVDVAVARAIWTVEELVEFLHATVAGDEKEFNRILIPFIDGIEAAVVKQLAVGPISQDEVVIAQADALTDISYFNYGSFVVAGVDPQPVFDIVQAANMAKLGADGKPIKRADGKTMKPEGWVAPEPLIEAEIKRQINEFGDGPLYARTVLRSEPLTFKEE